MGTRPRMLPRRVARGRIFLLQWRRKIRSLQSWEEAAMDEKVFDVTTIYIQNSLADNYSLEFYCRNKNIKLNYSHVEGIEMVAKVPVELKTSFMQMAENMPKVWNMKLGYPTNFRISFNGRIIIESI
jgi:hypothetical protein